MGELNNLLSQDYDKSAFTTDSQIPDLDTRLKPMGDLLELDASLQEFIARKSGEYLPPFLPFLLNLRESGVRVSTSEWLDFQQILANGRVRDKTTFYLYAKVTLIKDIGDYDRFERVFTALFYPEQVENEKPEDTKVPIRDLNKSTAMPVKTEIYGNETIRKLMMQMEQDDYDDEVEGIDDTQDRKDKPIVQKEMEGIKKVAPAGSQSTESTHGGDEATKDIPDSPNPADEGINNQFLKESDGGGSDGTQRNVKGENGIGQNPDAQRKEGQTNGERKSSGDSSNTIQIVDVDEPYEGGLKAKLAERRYVDMDRRELLTAAQISNATAMLTSVIEQSVPRGKRVDVRKTVEGTLRRAGLPEVKYREEVEDSPELVVLFDIGGTADPFIPIFKRLIEAMRTQFPAITSYNFHNAIYGEVWPENEQWPVHPVPLEELMDRDDRTKIIVVGDAKMKKKDLQNGGLYDSGYMLELAKMYAEKWGDNFENYFYDYIEEDPEGTVSPRLSAEELLIKIARFNDFKPTKAGGYYDVSGRANLQALVARFPNTVWLNPILEREHHGTDMDTVREVKEAIPMYDLSLDGLENAMQKLME